MNGCCQICGKQDIELVECKFQDSAVFAGKVCATKKYGKTEVAAAINAAKAAKLAATQAEARERHIAQLKRLASGDFSGILPHLAAKEEWRKERQASAARELEAMK